MRMGPQEVTQPVTQSLRWHAADKSMHAGPKRAQRPHDHATA